LLPQRDAQVGRRAPAGEDGLRTDRRLLGAVLEFCDESVCKSLLLGGVLALGLDDAEEIAVVALVKAEGQVQV